MHRFVASLTLLFGICKIVVIWASWNLTLHYSTFECSRVFSPPETKHYDVMHHSIFDYLATHSCPSLILRLLFQHLRQQSVPEAQDTVKNVQVLFFARYYDGRRRHLDQAMRIGARFHQHGNKVVLVGSGGMLQKARAIGKQNAGVSSML